MTQIVLLSLVVFLFACGVQSAREVASSGAETNNSDLSQSINPTDLQLEWILENSCRSFGDIIWIEGSLTVTNVSDKPVYFWLLNYAPVLTYGCVVPQDVSNLHQSCSGSSPLIGMDAYSSYERVNPGSGRTAKFWFLYDEQCKFCPGIKMSLTAYASDPELSGRRFIAPHVVLASAPLQMPACAAKAQH